MLQKKKENIEVLLRTLFPTLWRSEEYVNQPRLHILRTGGENIIHYASGIAHCPAGEITEHAFLTSIASVGYGRQTHKLMTWLLNFISFRAV